LLLESIQCHYTGRYTSYKKPTQIFGNVRCSILGNQSTPLCGLADRHGRKADLNWKLKTSSMADNADITQSQARDTTHRRMQKVNSLCTDSRPLRAEYCIVGIHTQYSHLINICDVNGNRSITAIKLLNDDITDHHIWSRCDAEYHFILLRVFCVFLIYHQ